MFLSVPVHRLFLWHENPRHSPVQSEARAIELLCRNENVLELISDIAEHGLNPAERLILFPTDDAPLGEETNYIVVEGNRRVCALKLLHDPARAPSNIRQSVERLSRDWLPIESVDAVVINDETRRRLWLTRIHDGPQGGRGRRSWSPEQKTRFNGNLRNRLAQLLLDYAENIGLLDPKERPGRLSHMARLVQNPALRHTLGVSLSDDAGTPQRTRPKEDFDTILQMIIKETKEKRLGSQAKSEDIRNFAAEIEQSLLGKIRRTQPESLEGDQKSARSASTANPAFRARAPEIKQHLYLCEATYKKLNESHNQKLAHLYYSITSVSVQTHTSLIAVGIWVFLESLSNKCGRSERTSFPDFWNKSKIEALDAGSGEKAKAVNSALRTLSRAGNITKHDGVAAAFDANQITNDWLAIRRLIEKATDEASKHV